MGPRRLPIPLLIALTGAFYAADEVPGGSYAGDTAARWSTLGWVVEPYNGPDPSGADRGCSGFTICT